MELTRNEPPTRAPRDAGSSQAIRFASGTLGEYRHVCAFFRSTDERYRVLLPFIKEGFERGEKAFHVVDPTQRADHVRRLEAAGIDVATAGSTGQFSLADWGDTYLRNGCFDQDQMLALLQRELDETGVRKFPLSRLICDMAWALEDLPGVNDLLEYETRFNLVRRAADPVICVYDLARWDAATIVDVLRTHPMVVIGAVLQENPFFVPPEELLRELSQRM